MPNFRPEKDRAGYETDFGALQRQINEMARRLGEAERKNSALQQQVASLTGGQARAGATPAALPSDASGGGSAGANTVFAGPESGAGAAGEFRALVAADIPDIVAVQDNGGTVYTRRAINLIAGAGVTLTITDNAAQDRVDVTIAV